MAASLRRLQASMSTTSERPARAGQQGAEQGGCRCVGARAFNEVVWAAEPHARKCGEMGSECSR